MNGMHDLGGMHGFGSVPREKDEPYFHAEWEKRMFGMSRACLAQKVFNQDEARHGIERVPPREYLNASYYERWLARTLRLCLEKRLITPEEFEARVRHLTERPDDPGATWQDPALVARMLRALTVRPDYRRPAPAPRFAAGDPIVTRHDHPAGHTRLPRYARGKRGVIQRVHGGFVFPDTNAHGGGEEPHTLYSVRFEAAELWGASAETRSAVHLDLWEAYLEPAHSGEPERSRT